MIRKIKIGKEFEVKKNTETMDKNIFIYKNQIPMINQLYLREVKIYIIINEKNKFGKT